MATTASINISLLRSEEEQITIYKAPFLCNPLQLNKPTQLCNHHSLHTFNATGQCWTIARFILAFHVIPNLTIRAFTVPTKVSV